GTALVYSTYLTGSIGGNSGNGIALDSSGNVYVAGDGAFITKVNSAGSAVVYSTHLNGTNGSSTANGIAVDARGGAYVSGQTSSTDFPLLNPLQQSYGGGGDAFVAQLSQTGSIVYSTYLGGSGIDAGTAIAVNGSGIAYPIGNTSSIDFPTTD